MVEIEGVVHSSGIPDDVGVREDRIGKILHSEMEELDIPLLPFFRVGV